MKKNHREANSSILRLKVILPAQSSIFGHGYNTSSMKELNLLPQTFCTPTKQFQELGQQKIYTVLSKTTWVTSMLSYVFTAFSFNTQDYILSDLMSKWSIVKSTSFGNTIPHLKIQTIWTRLFVVLSRAGLFSLW